MGLQFDIQEDLTRGRVQAGEMLEQAMQVWSTKLEWKGGRRGTKGGEEDRKEQERKLNGLLREVELKQRQLLRLVMSRENMKQQDKLFNMKGQLQQKMQESIETLVVLTRENKEDGNEIELSIKQTNLEINNLEESIQKQELELRRLDRNHRNYNDKRLVVNSQYEDVHPYKKKQQEKQLEGELKELRRIGNVNQMRYVEAMEKISEF